MSILKANRIENLTTTDGGINVDNSGRIGIGTASPSYTTHINSSGATSLGVTTSSGSSEPQILLEDTSASDYFALQKNGQALLFKPQGSEKCRITSDGLTFNGDTAAANALDDYEEGTFTPTINSGFTASYDSQAGRYTKVGNVVHFFINIDLSSISGSSSDVYAEVEGLPFTATNTGNIDNAVTVAWHMNLGNNVYYAYIEQNNTSIVLLGEPSNGSRTHWNPGQVWDDNNGKLALSGTYTTTA